MFVKRFSPGSERCSAEKIHDGTTSNVIDVEAVLGDGNVLVVAMNKKRGTKVCISGTNRPHPSLEIFITRSFNALI